MCGSCAAVEIPSLAFGMKEWGNGGEGRYVKATAVPCRHSFFLFFFYLFVIY